MDREPGLNVRLKLTLSYAGFLVLAGGLMLAVVWVSLLRYIPDNVTYGLPWFPPNRGDPLNGFAIPAAMLLTFLLVLGLGGGWILAGRMLSPLARITDATRRAATGSLSHRIGLPGRRDEFRELADAFDAMLAQLEVHLAEQQRFAANASHELRTPLAISQTLLDVARSDPTRERDELIERLHAVNARAIDLTEALLLLSRADGRSFARDAIDLSLVAEDAAETLLPLAEQREITLDVTTETTPAIGSGALLLRMVTNLVQNAIVHNLPARGTVTVRTEARADASVLRVENTGPHLPADMVSTLTEPFQRGIQRTRTDEDAGVGLGLAIVHSIVRAHDGTLDLAPRPGGGLIATVGLPVAPETLAGVAAGDPPLHLQFIPAQGA